jgi:hypothetical protein
MIDKAIQVLRREWENLRCSLEMCGDIGDFNPEDFSISRWTVEKEYTGFISTLIEMDERLSQYGYATPEALTVFTVLASTAAEKLGLKEKLTFAFGMGYGFVRTGLVVYHRLEPRQILFYKIFYPFGAVKFHWDLNWDFDPSLVKIKLKIVYERFMSWQNSPQLYTEDFAQFQKMAEIWKEWNEVNE